MRRAARTDTNQSEIVEALRQYGASVQPLHVIGKGCPDLLIGFNGYNWLIEVKDGGKVPSKRKLTADEMVWHQTWCGHRDSPRNPAASAPAKVSAFPSVYTMLFISLH